MEERHEKAVTAARREKLKLLCRRYSLAEDDYEGLALALAIDHEPGFQAVNRQIAELPLADEVGHIARQIPDPVSARAGNRAVKPSRASPAGP